MKRIAILSLFALLLSACGLISPYKITFTTPSESDVNPTVDTLDFATSHSVHAAVVSTQCGDAPAIEYMPVIGEQMTVQTAHNLPLTMLTNEAPFTLCDITVGVFDNTTMSSSQKSIALYMYEKPVEEVPEEEEELPVDEYAAESLACEEQEGTWNPCGSACPEGAELCIQVCVPQCEFTEDATTNEPQLEPGDDTEPGDAEPLPATEGDEPAA
jgi:hypothetical protein